jgi:hypothetical protein
MAGDWIKMRTDLHTDPAVVRMAAVLGLDLFGVVGRLHTVWAWADAHADCHGRVTLVSHEWIDTLSRTPGLGAAMVAVGWLVSGDDGLTFPRFDRHMGAGAKARAQATERKRRSRTVRGSGPPPGAASAAGNGPAPAADVSRPERDESVTREEKRREEKKDPPSPPPGGTDPGGRRKSAAEDVPLPAELDTPAFRAAWADWLADRKARQKAVTERGGREQLVALLPLGPGPAIECIRMSIEKGWTGLFPERFAKPPPPKPPDPPRVKRAADNAMVNAPSAAPMEFRAHA